MEITDGSMASVEYCRAAFGKDIKEEERRSIRAALEKYCDIDTRGMMEIVDELAKMCV